MLSKDRWKQSFFQDLAHYANVNKIAIICSQNLQRKADSIASYQSTYEWILPLEGRINCEFSYIINSLSFFPLIRKIFENNPQSIAQSGFNLPQTSVK